MEKSWHRILQCFIIVIYIFSFYSCSDDEHEHLSGEVIAVNRFINNHMMEMYFWNSEMPRINYREEPDSKKYFYKLLKTPEDQWSFITDDINSLLAYFEGVQKTFGYSIQPRYLKQDSNQVVIFVEYVYRDSPAEAAGLKRGDMFYEINGSKITDKNYIELLSSESMVITLGVIDDKLNISRLSPQLNLKSVVMNTHPIVAEKILNISGRKIGYLAYTAFRDNYDTALVNTFYRFKSENITELVLDLRYNGGGDILSARKLAGLIAPASAKQEVFIKEKWNREMTHYFLQRAGGSEEDFILRILDEENNINLNRLFVLTTSRTASASEMIIYGLAPHMEVIQVGEETAGKYYGSVTIRDPGKNSSWAIQPIVMRSENSTNSINYAEGLIPREFLSDNIYNAQLGDPDEHFLRQAILKITTGAFGPEVLKATTQVLHPVKGFKEIINPWHNTMLPSLSPVFQPISP